MSNQPAPFTIVTAAEIRVGDTVRASGGLKSLTTDFRTVARIHTGDDGALTFGFSGPDDRAPEATTYYGHRKFRPGANVALIARGN